MLLEYVSTDTDDSEVQTLFERDADTYGRPSLFARALANNPAVLEARQQYVESLLDSVEIDDDLVELAYVTVATAQDCDYCVASHSEQLVEHVGLDEETVDILRQDDATKLDATLGEPERTVVDVARQIGKNPKRVSEAEIDSLREQGFDDETIVGLVTIAGTGVAATVIADTLNILPQDEGGPEEYAP